MKAAKQSDTIESMYIARFVGLDTGQIERMLLLDEYIVKHYEQAAENPGQVHELFRRYDVPFMKETILYYAKRAQSGNTHWREIKWLQVLDAVFGDSAPLFEACKRRLDYKVLQDRWPEETGVRNDVADQLWKKAKRSHEFFMQAFEAYRSFGPYGRPRPFEEMIALAIHRGNGDDAAQVARYQGRDLTHAETWKLARLLIETSTGDFTRDEFLKKCREDGLDFSELINAAIQKRIGWGKTRPSFASLQRLASTFRSGSGLNQDEIRLFLKASKRNYEEPRETIAAIEALLQHSPSDAARWQGALQRALRAARAQELKYNVLPRAQNYAQRSKQPLTVEEIRRVLERGRDSTDPPRDFERKLMVEKLAERLSSPLPQAKETAALVKSKSPKVLGGFFI